MISSSFGSSSVAIAIGSSPSTAHQYERRRASASPETAQLLSHLAHLYLLGALGDPVPPVMAVDVREGHVAAVADPTTRLHRAVCGVAGEAVGPVVAHRHEVRHLHVVTT